MLKTRPQAAFDPAAVQLAGAPRFVWTELRSAPGSRDLEVDVTWESKTATRLPEATWLRWQPRGGRCRACA